MSRRKTIEGEKKRKKEVGKYFYAVIPISEEKNFGKIGMNDAEVYTIPYREIMGVVSDTPIMRYELTEENVRIHHAVLRRIMEEYTLLPVEFGTVILDERILKNMWGRAYNSMKECLKLVDNMVEFGVKAILKKDVYLDKETRKISSLEVLEPLQKKAEQSVSGERFSDILIFNESFLVKRDEINAFSEEVARLQESYSNIKFIYSGPWPPYNFVSIKIGQGGMEIRKKE